MGIDRRVHDVRHLAKALLGIAAAPFGRGHADDELLVLNYHGTQARFRDAFERQLDWLADRFDFLDPAQLDAYFDGRLRTARPMVLMTFDDGLKSNLRAAQALERRGTRGYFLVVPGFVDTPVADQRDYFIRNIRPSINPHIDGEADDFTAMTWAELRDLERRGHGIGAHSMTHTLIASRATDAESHHEVVDSAEVIATHLGSRPTVFCGPNDSLLSCGEREMASVGQRYRYFFSTIPGSNRHRQRLFVRRVNVEPWWLLASVRWAVSPTEWRRWEPREQLFAEVVQRATGSSIAT